jgi:hypothetical protein
MPAKLPFIPAVLTWHRGTVLTDHKDNPVVKALWGQPKDQSLNPRNRPADLRPTQKPRGPLPSFSIKKVTPYTALTDNKSLKRAMQKTSIPLSSPADVRHFVRYHIQQEKARIRGQSGNDAAPIYLLGDDHISPAWLMACLAALREAGPNATVLFEYGRDNFGNLLRLVYRFDQILTTRPDTARNEINALINGPNLVRREYAISALLILAALKSGARIDCYDPGAHAAASLEIREAQMRARIGEHLRNQQGPIFVISGAAHVPNLHDHLEGVHDVIALTAVNEPLFWTPDHSDFRKRASYIFSTDRILKLRDGGLEATIPDVVEFAREQVDWTRQVQWTAPGRPAQYA